VTAAEQWAAELRAWAIDQRILDAAEDDPYDLPPALFAPESPSEHEPSHLHEAVRAALPPDGSVLDVGAGGGAASLPAMRARTTLHAVDQQAGMLRALEASAAEAGILATTYEGRWPDLAADVPVADVAVCGHVFYNVADLVPFVRALTDRSRGLVAVELTDAHPWVRLAPMWQEVHDQTRPEGPTVELALEVLAEAGLSPRVHERVRAPARRTGELLETWVDLTRRQLCLPRARIEEVRELMTRHPAGARRLVTVTWAGAGR
jgi:SAM-dependent methyltransferase